MTQRFRFFCNMCGRELLEPGALAFGPPNADSGVLTSEKWHICVPCWEHLTYLVDDEHWP